jgi:cytochrome oxidase Cu insertion factor (SCO1/SenC/PrrC family)
VLSSIVGGFARFDAAHGWAVNLAGVCVLVIAGLGLVLGDRRRLFLEWSLALAAVACLADWLLVQDLGFMGGTGTDPNSMLPTLLLLGAGYAAFTRPPAATRAGQTAEPGIVVLRLAAGLASIGVILVGVVPMAVVSVRARPDASLAAAIAGQPQAVDEPAPRFSLSDQNGTSISLVNLRGDAVLLTFLDPVCTTDCPVIGRELRAALPLLGSDARKVRLVAVNANPVFTNPAFLAAFDSQEGLSTISQWHYLTGTAAQLHQVWQDFGVDVEPGSGGSMMSHSDVAFVIDPEGRITEAINTDPGPATSATRSSFGALFAEALKRALAQ